MYLHATLTPKLGRLGPLAETVAWLKKGMESPAMQLVGGWETMSGAPGNIVDLWRIDDANTIVGALEAAHAHPKHQEAMDRLAESLVREQLRIVERTDYSPETFTASGRLLHATLRVKYGQHGRLFPVIAELKAVLEAQIGWRLAGAYRTVIGDFSEVFDLWEIPADRTVDDMLGEARGIPEFGAAARHLPDYLDAEDLLVLRPTAYHPSEERGTGESRRGVLTST